MTAADKARALAAETFTVPVPEWDSEAVFRKPSLGDVFAVADGFAGESQVAPYWAQLRLLAACLVDPVFDEGEDVAVILDRQPREVTQALIAGFNEQSGLGGSPKSGGSDDDR